MEETTSSSTSCEEAESGDDLMVQEGNFTEMFAVSFKGEVWLKLASRTNGRHRKYSISKKSNK